MLYVEELIGADTVDTIPPATFDAFRDHGKLRNSLTENVDAAAKTMSDLEKSGISMKEVTEKLVVDGVKLFAEAFDKLLGGHRQDPQECTREPKSPELQTPRRTLWRRPVVHQRLEK